MDSMSAFMMGQANKDKPIRSFDWIKAAKIIAREKPHRADAGLSGDYSYTRGTIWENGAPKIDDYTYLASTWATPMLILIDADGWEKEIDCWRYENESGFGSDTKWPAEAVNIATGK